MEYGLNEIRDIVMNQMKRLDELNISNDKANLEISRATAISQNATAYIKSINTEIKIQEAKHKYK